MTMCPRAGTELVGGEVCAKCPPWCSARRYTDDRMVIDRRNSGEVAIWYGADASQWYWWARQREYTEDDPAEPAPTLVLSEPDAHRLVFEILRGPAGASGPPGPMGMAGRDADA